MLLLREEFPLLPPQLLMLLSLYRQRHPSGHWMRHPACISQGLVRKADATLSFSNQIKEMGSTGNGKAERPNRGWRGDWRFTRVRSSCCPRAEGTAGEGRFIRTQRLGPARRSQKQGKGFPGRWTHSRKVCFFFFFFGGGEQETSEKRSSRSQGPHRKRQSREDPLAFPLSYSPIICHCLPLAEATQKVLTRGGQERGWE